MRPTDLCRLTLFHDVIVYAGRNKIGSIRFVFYECVRLSSIWLPERNAWFGGDFGNGMPDRVNVISVRTIDRECFIKFYPAHRQAEEVNMYIERMLEAGWEII